MKHSYKTPFLIILVTVLTGCNFFAGLDSPSGDEQLLSKARACFDQGDFDCARENYQAVSTNYQDIKNSETAFLILDEQGINLGTFLAAFASGDGGSGLNELVNALVDGAGEEKRLAIFSALEMAGDIEQIELRGLVRFVSAMSLTAEILAEDAGVASDSTKFTGNDFVEDAEECESLSQEQCLLDQFNGSGDCFAPADATIETGTVIDSDDFSEEDFEGNPTLFQFDFAINQVNTALTSEVGAGGTFETGAGDFAEEITSEDIIENAPSCYRKLLLELGVGG